MRTIILPILIVLLASCTSGPREVKCDSAEKCDSALISKKLKNGDVESGVVYALPMQYMIFELKRTQVTKKKLQTALNQAKAKEKTSNTAVNNQEKTLIPALKIKHAAATQGPTKAKLALELEIAQLDLLIMKKKLAKDKLSTANAQKEFDDFKKDHYKDTISLKASDPVPDAENRFIAQPNPGFLSAETIEIKTTKDGLLSGGSGKSEGQIDEIFVGLVSAVASLQATTFKLSTLTVPLVNLPKGKCDKKETKFKFTFSLRDPNGLTNLNNALSAAKLCYKLVEITPAPAAVADIGTQYVRGLVYPRTVAMQYDLIKTDTGNPVHHKSFFPTVIDGRSLGVIPLDKGYFATNEYEFEFANGLLTRYKAVTPNEFVSFLAMFPAAAKALVSIPAEIIQLKVNYSSQEEAYYTAQQAALAARLAYESAQTANSNAIEGNDDSEEE